LEDPASFYRGTLAIDHGDSMANTGIIQPGDVQWMTTGSRIITQEMPKGQKGGLIWGFPHWTNLPALYIRMAPRYRYVESNQSPLNRDPARRLG
jgi:quercetin 2,3-dioxygenase